MQRSSSNISLVDTIYFYILYCLYYIYIYIKCKLFFKITIQDLIVKDWTTKKKKEPK